MRKLCTALLLTVALSAQAQWKVDRLWLNLSAGVGISTEPALMRSWPMYNQAGLYIRFANQWVVVPELVVTGFRHPTISGKHGLIIARYARYTHQMWGMRVGRNVWRRQDDKQLVFSTGLNSLELLSPVRKTGGFFSSTVGQSVSYHVNIPLQIDYLIRSSRTGMINFSGRCNFNRFSPSLAFFVGLNSVFYKRRQPLSQP